MLYITGDTHGERARFQYKESEIAKNLKIGDYLFICGDWGYISTNSNEENGTIINVSKDSIDIKTSDGAIGILEFQLQGKTRIKVKDYLNGNNKFQIGTKIE